MMVSVSHAADWPDYGGTPDQSKYAVATGHQRKNISKLEVAWTYPTGDERAYQFNPIIVDGVMYVLAKDSSLVAIDVVTRKELWIHANLRGITNRGINYWQSRDARTAACCSRSRIRCRPSMRAPANPFSRSASNGFVDLAKDWGAIRPPFAAWCHRRRAAIFEDLLILGSSPGEGYFSAPGHIRAYNVITGELAWTFHTIPQPGEFGYDTWPPDA